MIRAPQKKINNNATVVRPSDRYICPPAGFHNEQVISLTLSLYSTGYLYNYRFLTGRPQNWRFPQLSLLPSLGFLLTQGRTQSLTTLRPLSCLPWQIQSKPAWDNGALMTGEAGKHIPLQVQTCLGCTCCLG